MTGQTRNAALNDAREVLLPRTLPVTSMDDLTPYHWVRNEQNNLELRRGAPPARVKQAAAAFGEGEMTLNEFLDAVGVAKS